MKHLLFTLLIIPIFAKADVLYELAPGSHWLYVGNSGGESFGFNIRVKGLESVDGKVWARMEEDGEEYWIRNSEQGQSEAISFDNSGLFPSVAGEELVYKFPAKVDEVWYSFGSIVKYLGIKSVEVPAGQFDCHMYYTKFNKDDYMKTCIAQNVGIIYDESMIEGYREVSELKAYDYVRRCEIFGTCK